MAAATASAIANRIAQAYNDKIKPYADLGYVVEQFGQSYARREQYGQNLKTFNEVATKLFGPLGGYGLQVVQNLTYSAYDCAVGIAQECIQSFGTGLIDVLTVLTPFAKLGPAISLRTASLDANIALESGVIINSKSFQVADEVYMKIKAKNGQALYDVPKPINPPAGFKNIGEYLPKLDSNGNSIIYAEYDIYPSSWNSAPGVPRNSERIITGTDGSVYYTPDHYVHFFPLR